jgi:hypothetical protein
MLNQIDQAERLPKKGLQKTIIYKQLTP